jgi:hypothetical protein
MSPSIPTLVMKLGALSSQLKCQDVVPRGTMVIQNEVERSE